MHIQRSTIRVGVFYWPIEEPAKKDIKMSCGCGEWRDRLGMVWWWARHATSNGNGEWERVSYTGVVVRIRWQFRFGTVSQINIWIVNFVRDIERPQRKQYKTTLTLRFSLLAFIFSCIPLPFHEFSMHIANN